MGWAPLGSAGLVSSSLGWARSRSAGKDFVGLVVWLSLTQLGSYYLSWKGLDWNRLGLALLSWVGLGLARLGSTTAVLHSARRLGLATVSWARLSWNFLDWVGSAWLGLVVWHVWSSLGLFGTDATGRDLAGLCWASLAST